MDAEADEVHRGALPDGRQDEENERAPEPEEGDDVGFAEGVQRVPGSERSRHFSVRAFSISSAGFPTKNRLRQVFDDKLIPVFFRDILNIKDNNDIINAGGIQIETGTMEAIVL